MTKHELSLRLNQSYPTHTLAMHLPIHCRTEYEAEALCDFFHNQGFKWVSGKSYKDFTNFDCYNENTYYTINGNYGSIKFTKARHELITFPDFKKLVIDKVEGKENAVKKFLFTRGTL